MAQERGPQAQSPCLLMAYVAGMKTDLVCVRCMSQGWASWPHIHLIPSKPPGLCPSWGHRQEIPSEETFFRLVGLHDAVMLSWTSR